jgi:hypothetical protein
LLRRRIALLGALALCSALVGLGQATAAPASPAFHPKARGMLDCNGYSRVQKPLAHLQCTEVSGKDKEGFEINGHYVGHDEPSLQFMSTIPGSGNSAKYKTTLPVDPPGQPDGTTSGPVYTFQQRIADWFGMVMCDTESYPEGSNTCTPDSDSNIQVPPQPNHAGAAYMELQFYPPGDPPFVTNISCDRTHWCAALTIDSLQADFGFAHQNPNCVEPVNFAYVQKDGVPTGPPGPDTANLATFTPNNQTLMMNPGDRLTVSMFDTRAGFSVEVRDLTTGEHGTMVASAGNGFRQIIWDPVNYSCNGRDYTFHPMYSTASPPDANGQPRTWATWSAHTYNVAYTPEIGHAEPVDGDDVDDGYCPPNDLSFPMCQSTDTDFDGYSYRHIWNVARNHPSVWYVDSPLSRRSDVNNGHWQNPYSQVAFETDLPRIEAADFAAGTGHTPCNRNNGRDCVNPPPGAGFYPWFHLSDYSGCAWSLSDDIPGQISNFGGERASYGPLYFVNYGFTTRTNNFNSGPFQNPCP